jgi:xylose isomerase
MYLLLKERAAAFEADPEVQEVKHLARLHELSQPTLSAGEGYRELLAAGDADTFDPGAYFNGKGFNFVRLNQLALEHLMGAR